ncbi:hypothetical protein PRIPAC_97049 [Pristionchus pacificus]|uniref:Chromo domain-containing protein n=1 Tax=Pristionchus pacificus TaxID=54126 RepID=A0A2A6BDM8_PRIPA|nr:hypothetical protein PRIPAC_97049 [Pristionchus pacificus]|eukprot:PDM64005.1 hypothetical protein PRIPAC_49506 [Pristionchus pacificus]
MARMKTSIYSGQRSGKGPLPTKASGKMKNKGKAASASVRSSVRSDIRKGSEVRSGRAPSRTKSTFGRRRSSSRERRETTEEKKYEVEQVCGVKLDKNGKAVEYLLLWKENSTMNVAEGTQTWEPISCASACQDLVKAFEMRQRTGRYIVNDVDYVTPTTSSNSSGTIQRPRSQSPADCIHESVCRRYLHSIGRTKADYSPAMLICESFLTPRIVLGHHVLNVTVTPGRENDIIVYPEEIRSKFVDYMDNFNEIVHRHHPHLHERRHFCVWRRALICTPTDCVCEAHYASLCVADCQYYCESLMIRRPDSNPVVGAQY